MIQQKGFRFMRKTKIALAASLSGVITIWALSSSAVFAASPQGSGFMTAEEEILPANKTVRATVTVNAVPSGWAADQGGLIDPATGIIIRPEKTFTIAVAEKFTDAMVVEDAKNQLEIPNANDIRGNITLPMELSASDGSGAAATITWATTNASIVDVNAEGSVPAGVVNRQAKDAHVTLTATIKSGKESGTKTFDLLIKAKANVEETTAYLFGHFTGEGIDEEQIYFASSRDGNFWTDLNDRQPVLKSEIGMKGVRDPYIIRSHEGDKFYMLATDLSVRLQGWSNATSRGSRNLVIWESTDLVNWSEPWLSEVAVPGAGNAWAPEAIYDESTGEYVVFWASIVAGEAKMQRVKNNSVSFIVKHEISATSPPHSSTSHGRRKTDPTPISLTRQLSRQKGNITAPQQTVRSRSRKATPFWVNGKGFSI